MKYYWLHIYSLYIHCLRSYLPCMHGVKKASPRGEAGALATDEGGSISTHATLTKPHASHPQNGRDSRTLQQILTSPNTKKLPPRAPALYKANPIFTLHGRVLLGEVLGERGRFGGREPPLRKRGLSPFKVFLPLPPRSFFLTPRKLQPTSGTRRGRNGGQDQDRVTLREPSHRSPICRRGDTCCCGEASSAPERRT